MTKHLRLIMLSLLAMICLGGYSQSETVFKTLSFPDENKENNNVQSYTTTWDAKIGNDTWSIANCNNNNWTNNWEYIAMGSKDAKSVASIATTTELAAAITKVVVNYNKAENLAKNLNSIKLIVASDKEFKNDVVTIEGDKSFSTATPSTFTITTPAEKRYFKLEYDLNNTVNEKGSAKNGMIRIKSIEYYSKPASSKTPTTTTFGEEVDNNTFEVKDGETVVTRVATVTPVEATGSIEYESSDEAIAKVDDKTGAITLGAKYGTATITAQFVATGNYANSEARYSIKHVGDFVFYESFDNCDGTGGNDNKWSGNLLGNELKPERADNPGWTFVKGRERNQCASFGVTDNGGSATSPNIQIDQKAQLKFKASRWSTDNEKSQINISVSDGTLTYNGKNSQSVTIDVVRDTWTDYSMIVSGTNSFTVTFAGSGKYNRFFLDEVMVTKVAPQEISLDENSDNIVKTAENVNVTLKRTFFHDNAWNTLCLPFDVDANKVATAFAGAEIREIDPNKCTANTIQFVPATEIKAGVPYIIKWNENVAEAKPFEKTFEGVTLIAEPKPVKVNNDITFTGFYNKTTADKLGESVAAIGAENKLFKVTSGEMKGFRAAFVLNSNAQPSAIKLVIDGTATGIEDLVIDGVKANGRVYNLNGQYVGNSLNGLQPGLYIQNGKKIVVK